MQGPGLLEILLFAGFWLGLPGGAFYLLLRLVRAFERRSVARDEMATLEARILQLEEHVSALTEQLDQLAEGQRFTTRVLAERPASNPAT